MRINVVAVNHNTSLFTELAVRSLLKMHGPRSNWRLVVLDNASTDETQVLKEYAEGAGIEFHQSGLQADDRQANSHGEIIRQFVMTNPDCDYYLLLDTDICFVMQNTVDQMLSEFKNRDEAWAIQARVGLDSTYLFKSEKPVLTQDLSEYRSKEFAEKKRLYLHHQKLLFEPIADNMKDPISTMSGSGKPRCSPMCTLIKNTPAFRRVADRIGLSSAWIYEDNMVGAGMYDTMGLLTAVMTTHEQIYLTSSQGVIHFGGSTYGLDRPVKKLRRDQCCHLLEVFRRNESFDFSKRDWMIPEYRAVIEK